MLSSSSKMQGPFANSDLHIPWRPLPAHIPALDGLRGLAILLVMLYHQSIIRPAVLSDRIFARIFDFGWCGVDLFFVLSGFLITGILLDTKTSDGCLRCFYARRILRIFPLYYAVVFFSLVVLPYLSHPKVASFGRIAGDELWYWSYLSNLSIARAGAWRHGILDVSWSLAIEEQFYLVWPMLVLLLSSRALRWVCLGSIAVALSFRVSLLKWGADPISIYVLTPSRIDALAIGAWIAVSVREPAAGIARLRQIAAKLMLPLIVGVLVLAACNQNRRSQDAPLTQAVGFTMVALLAGAALVIVVAAKQGSLCHQVFNSRFMRTFGKYSYALYLFHLPLRALVRDTVLSADQFPQFMGSRIPGQLLFFVVSSTLTLGAAWLSWNLYEKHFLRLKRYFEPGASKRAITPGELDKQPAVAPWSDVDFHKPADHGQTANAQADSHPGT
jgi:peptidoglycan/LPS O-acetylase OafA/YrhL